MAAKWVKVFHIELIKTLTIYNYNKSHLLPLVTIAAPKTKSVRAKQTNSAEINLPPILTAECFLKIIWYKAHFYPYCLTRPDLTRPRRALALPLTGFRVSSNFMVMHTFTLYTSPNCWFLCIKWPDGHTRVHVKYSRTSGYFTILASVLSLRRNPIY
jgi:hypothetical protein